MSYPASGNLQITEPFEKTNTNRRVLGAAPTSGGGLPYKPIHENRRATGTEHAAGCRTPHLQPSLRRLPQSLFLAWIAGAKSQTLVQKKIHAQRIARQ